MCYVRHFGRALPSDEKRQSLNSLQGFNDFLASPNTIIIDLQSKSDVLYSQLHVNFSVVLQNLHLAVDGGYSLSKSWSTKFNNYYDCIFWFHEK